MRLLTKIKELHNISLTTMGWVLQEVLGIKLVFKLVFALKIGGH